MKPMKLSLLEVVKMSLSRRLIKNKQVDVITDCLEIPLAQIRLAHKKEPAIDEKIEEEINKTKAELDKVIRQAETQAQDIIRSAREQSDAIKEKARDEGYKAGLHEGKRSGYQAGYNQAMQDTEEMKQKAKALLQNAH